MGRASGPHAGETPESQVGRQFEEVDVGTRGIPESSARIRRKDRWRIELQGRDIKAFPFLLFIAESEVKSEAG